MQNKKIVITDSMSNKEIIKLLSEDWVFAWHKVDETRNKYRKLARAYKHKKERVYFKPLTFTSAKGFNYVLRYYKIASDEKEKDILNCDMYVWFVKKRGIYGVITTEMKTLAAQETYYHIYTPHFFDRYRERFLKDLSIPKQEVLERYFFGNKRGVSMESPSEKYPDSVWSRCNDGLCLCNLSDNKIIEVKTFVTFDMATGGKRQEFIDKTIAASSIMGFEFNLPDEDFDEYSEESINQSNQ